MFRIFFVIVLVILSCNPKSTPQYGLLKEIETLQEKTWQTRDTNEVKRLLEKGLNLSNNIEDDTTRINYTRKMTCEYFNHALYSQYIDLTNSNLQKALKLKDSTYIATLLLDKGDYHQVIYQFDSAYFYYRKALPYFNEVNKYQILTNYEISRILNKQNLHSESEAILYQNLQNAINYGDPEIVYRYYNSLGVNHTATKQFDLAIEVFNNALYYNNLIEVEKVPKIKSNNKTQTLINKGWAYLEKRDFENAKKYFDDAKLEHQIGNRPYNLTQLLIKTEKLNLLSNQGINLDNCLLALKISQENNIQENEANAKSLIGIYYFQEKDNENGMKYLNEAIEICKALDLNFILLDIYTVLSQFDQENENRWLKETVNVQNKLTDNFQQTRNKFAKITFDTETVHSKNLVLERKINNLFTYSIIGVCFLLSGFLLYKKRTDNLILKLDKMQKESDIANFNLLLEQQSLIVQGQTMERKRFSKELHDAIGSDIYFMRFTTSLEKGQEVFPLEKVETLNKNIINLEKSIRSISHGLAYTSINENKLVQLIEKLVEEQKTYVSYDIEFDWNENYHEGNISNNLKVNIYRIIQESLKNINKYADAKQVLIYLGINDDGNELTLKIEDDGKGFNTSKTRIGIGLKNIEERTINCNGHFSLKSIIDLGTSIICIFNLPGISCVESTLRL